MNIDISANVPDVVNAVVEIPREANVTYELDKRTGVMKMDRVLYRVLYPAVHYPANYGFIPQTLAVDVDRPDPAEAARSVIERANQRYREYRTTAERRQPNSPALDRPLY